MNNRIDWKTVFKLGGAYAAFHIGAGFASGQETMQYFGSFGSPSVSYTHLDVYKRQTVDIGKEAVDCGLWYLAEFENGRFTINRDPKEFSSVEDYLKKQSRFTNLDDHDLERIIAERDATWQRIRNDWVK